MLKSGKIILCIALFALVSCGKQGNDEFAHFTRQVEQIRKDYCNQGLALAIVRDNEVVYNQGFGELQPESLARIASISKTFVGMALMQQVATGNVSLGDDVSKLLGFEVRNPRFPKVPVTLENLLSHTSSLNDRFSELDQLNPLINSNFSEAYLDYAPGKGYCYCEYNIILAANILERITGERFDDYIRNHILRPFGIDADYNLDSLEQKRVAKLYYVSRPDSLNGLPQAEEATNAYRSVAERLVDYRIGNDAHVFAPASGMKISANGLAKWMIVLMNSPFVEEMSRPRYPSYHNYGITLLQSADYSSGVSLVGHKGGAYGLRSAFYFRPLKSYGFVVISSGALNQPIADSAADEALNIDPDYLYMPDGEGDTSIRVPILRLMYQTLFPPL